MTDDQLVQALKRRDPAALEEFHRRYRSRIFAVARRIVRDDWDAEEVVQDVVLTVHRKIDLFNGNSAFWSWCYRVTENAAKMKVRKYARTATPFEDEILQNMVQTNRGDEACPRPDDTVIGRESMARIAEFLERADDTNRQLYLYMDVEGLTKEEAAERLDLSIPALKARLHRIRYALKDFLAEPA
jgi:RNA polymerase sigma-70 factor (ECF subfamily)